MESLIFIILVTTSLVFGDKECGKIRGCVEYKLFNTGPAKYAGSWQTEKCDYLSAVMIEDIRPGGFDPRKAELYKNGTCHIFDDSGCQLTFWYGYDKERNLRTWSDKDSRVCPPSEVKFVSQISSNNVHQIMRKL